MKSFNWVFKVLTALVSAVFLAGLAAGSASAAEIAPSGTVKIVNQANGGCLQYWIPSGWTPYNGDPIASNWCDHGGTPDPQVWRFVRLSDGPVKGFGNFPRYLISNTTSGLCLDVRGGSMEDKAAVQQYACNGNSTSMIWVLFSSSTGGKQLVNARSGKCLDDPYASRTLGQVLWQYGCTAGNYAQGFIFSPA